MGRELQPLCQHCPGVSGCWGGSESITGDHRRTSNGELVGRVGNAEPQTPQSYRYKIVSKFPADSYLTLQTAFHDFLQAYSPEKLNTRLVYALYDQWKKSCAAGRLINLEKLIAWCADSKPPIRAS
jgi:hypothetical protein